MLYILSFFIGMLTAFSPCVLPLTPIIVKSSISKNRYTSLISSLGLIIAFTIFGLIFGVVESHFSEHLVKNIAGFILILLGISMLIPNFKNHMHKHKKHNCVCEHIDSEKPTNNLLFGFLLGMAWIPCSMHTLGIVIGLASTNIHSKLSFLVFMLFAIGISIPIIGASWLAKEFFIMHSKKIKKIGQIGNKILAFLIIVIGISAILGH